MTTAQAIFGADNVQQEGIGVRIIAPASFFQNRYLADIRDFSGGMIGLFSIAVGTPASIGLILGGRVADTSGRRRLIAFTLPLGTAAIVAAFTVGGGISDVASAAAVLGAGADTADGKC